MDPIEAMRLRRRRNSVWWFVATVLICSVYAYVHVRSFQGRGRLAGVPAPIDAGPSLTPAEIAALDAERGRLAEEVQRLHARLPDGGETAATCRELLVSARRKLRHAAVLTESMAKALETREGDQFNSVRRMDAQDLLFAAEGDVESVRRALKRE